MTGDHTQGDVREESCSLIVAPDDDNRLEACIDARRRAAALHELRAHQRDLIPDVGVVSVHDLAHVLMSKEADVPCEDVYDRNVEWMENELLDDHLPVLDELGVIEFDLAEETVTATPALKMFDAVLQGSDLGALKNPLTKLPAGQLGWFSGHEYEGRTHEDQEQQGEQETGDE